MPFKSKAQMRWMFAAEKRGDVKKGTAERWAKHTKNMKKLPARKGKKAQPGDLYNKFKAKQKEKSKKVISKKKVAVMGLV